MATLERTPAPATLNEDALDASTVVSVTREGGALRVRVSHPALSTGPDQAPVEEGPASGWSAAVANAAQDLYAAARRQAFVRRGFAVKP